MLNSTRSRGSAILNVLSLSLTLSFAAWSQAPTGEIVGTVVDQTGAVVSGGTVMVTNAATGVTRSLTTNAAGVYDAPALTPGIYSVRVAHEGIHVHRPLRH